MKFVVLFLFPLMAGAVERVDQPVARRFGHNVSATTAVLAEHQCTVGLQVSGCGVTENWTLGTVSWLYANYNMWSVVSRYRLKTYDDGGAWSTQFAFFRSFHQKRDKNYLTYPYQMEAYWLQFVRSVPLSRHYRVYINFHSNYYADDKRPFSLRRPIPNRNAGQFAFTTLHEVDLFSNWFLMAELGLLDVLQPSWPYVHAGVSFGQTSVSYEWHLGFSITSTPLGFFNPRTRRDYQQELRDTESGFNQELDRERTKRDYAIHPEFAIQVYF